MLNLTLGSCSSVTQLYQLNIFTFGAGYRSMIDYGNILIQTDRDWSPGDYRIEITGIGFEESGAVICRANYLFRLKNNPVLDNVKNILFSTYMGDIWKTGQPIKFRVTTESPQTMRYHILSGGETVVSRTFQTNTPVITYDLDTLPTGTYIFRITDMDNNTVYTHRMYHVTAGVSSFHTATLDRDSFYPGETVKITLMRTDVSKRCRIKLTTQSGYIIMLSDRKKCSSSMYIDLPESVSPGRYLILVDIYDYDIVIDEIRMPIVILSRLRSVSELCASGYYISSRFRIKCIYREEICYPGESDLPGCLCVGGENNRQTFLDVCESGEMCGQSGCVNNKIRPYTVIKSPEKCNILMGNEMIPCSEVGEICNSVRCACLDDTGDIVDYCTVDEICTFEGCRNSKLKVTPRKIMNNIYQRYNPDMDAIRVQISAKYNTYPAKNVFFRAFTSDGVNFTVKYDICGDGCYMLEMAPVADPVPGRTLLYIKAIFMDSEALVKLPVIIWYPVGGSLYIRDVVIPDVLMTDSEKKYCLSFRLYDDRLLSITDDRYVNLTLMVSDKQIPITEFHYDPVRESFTGLFSFDAALDPGRYTLTININYLGKRGMFASQVSVAEPLPLSVDILEVDPKRVFQTQTVWGFEIRLLLDVHGSFDDMTVDVNGRTYRPVIIPQGSFLDVRVPGVKFCPEIITGELDVPLSVELRSGSHRVTATTSLHVVPNPGGWINNICRS